MNCFCGRRVYGTARGGGRRPGHVQGREEAEEAAESVVAAAEERAGETGSEERCVLIPQHQAVR